MSYVENPRISAEISLTNKSTQHDVSAPGIQWHDDFNAFLIISKTFIWLYQWNIISYDLHKKPSHLFRTNQKWWFYLNYYP